MKSEFEEMCESFGVLKSTKRVMYPRQIKLSEEFLKALKNEWFKSKLEEEVSGPVKNKPAKFLKAMQFHVADFEKNADSEVEAYKRMMEEETAPEQTGTDFKADTPQGNKKVNQKKEMIRKKEVEKQNMELTEDKPKQSNFRNMYRR